MPALEERTATVNRIGSGQGRNGGLKMSLRELLSGFRLNKAVPLASILPERGPFSDKDDDRR